MRVLAHVEVGTLDGSPGIGAERILLDHRVRHGLEGGDGQGDRLGDALQGQLAFDLATGLSPSKYDLGGLEGGGRVLGGVEEIFALNVLVEDIGVAGITDLVSISISTEPGLGALSSTTLPEVLSKRLSWTRVAEVAVREAREGVGGRR
jgi:hypothetical protein